MKDKIINLLNEHIMLSKETFEQLSELNKLDLSKFSDKERKDVLTTISELELEYSMRKLFISDLQSLT